MTFLVKCALVCMILASSYAFTMHRLASTNSLAKHGASSLQMGITLYGSPQSRSPLVNWYLYENDIPFDQKPPRPSNHPFGQTPYLTDDNGVEVFESGAILLYLADAYGGNPTPAERASYTKVRIHTSIHA
jgi:hypothetical protein